jgi:transposase-like protein
MNQAIAAMESVPPLVPDPEVNGKPKRRTFTAEYKRKILKEAEACKGAGGVGALLRREGLYSSHLTHWRREFEQGALRGLAPKKRGRKAQGRNPLASQLAKLEKENQWLQKRLKQVEAIVEIQTKACELLGIPPAQEPQGRRKTGKNG